MINFMGIEYGRGATANIVDGGPANGPAAVRKMFPNENWTIVTADPITPAECMADRFGDCARVQAKIYSATPTERHIMIGGDHSVNFGHFAALTDRVPGDLCLVYIDAHLDMHTPESSRAQASGAPHGTNVRHLMGDGDARWLGLQSRCPALRPENCFYLASRSWEDAEIQYVRDNNIFIRTADQMQTDNDITAAIDAVRAKIGDRPFVVSFDMDAIDPAYFPDVLVPESGGISVDTARRLVTAFADAHGFEFVEYSSTGDQSSADIIRELITIAAK